MTALSIDILSIFLLCLISPQVIIPVQRTQSRLTALSIDIPSILNFLLCLISPQIIIPVQRIQSRLTALSVDISSIFLLCLISPQVIGPVQRTQSRLIALSKHIPSILNFLLCLISPQVIIPVQRTQSRLTVHRHLHISASSYLTTSYRSCPTNSVSLDCSVHRHLLHISAQSQVISPQVTARVQRTQSGLTALSKHIPSILNFLLCLISPQVLIPVQRTQSRLTALSKHIPSIFLLGLISQVIIPVQRPHFHSISLHFACFSSQLG